MASKQLITPVLLTHILADYQLNLHGIHGISHWGRVLENGLKLAEVNGADPVVITYFALFHDSRRENDHRDPGHGRRGAELFLALLHHMPLSESQKDQVVRACRHHTDGTTEEDITVQTCWDSDRLDLWRVGITPRPSLLCTDVGKDEKMLSWAKSRSFHQTMPACSEEWLRMIGAD